MSVALASDGRMCYIVSYAHPEEVVAYNYRREYLMANEELLRKLINLADTDMQGEAEFADPGKAQAFQFKVNNLLASLASNHPGRAYVRKKVRTWVTARGDRTIVVIGVPAPGHVLRGARPLPIEVKPREIEGILTIPGDVTANWPMVGVKLAAAKHSQDVRRIVLLAPPNEDGIKFISDHMAPEFQLVSSGPPMVLERIASASQDHKSVSS